jgi:hypothetical protein
VAEVPQAGWPQRGPAPVPPGTYTQTLAAGQDAYGLDFGNQQLPPGPPPSSTPDQPPDFTSTAPNPGTVTVGQVFTYDATANDPDGGVPLTFDLPVHPTGMAVDPQLGVVVWQPTPDQAGLSAPVLLRVTDTQGSVALQAFTVNAVAANTPPVITSMPVTAATLNVPYAYAVQAQDSDGDPLTYSLPTRPTGMSINTSTGVMSWTPSYSQYGTNPVTVQVSDGQGGTATQSYSVNVSSSGTPTPPTITSTPQSAVVGQGYAYNATATDPDGDPLRFPLFLLLRLFPAANVPVRFGARLLGDPWPISLLLRAAAGCLAGSRRVVQHGVAPDRSAGR